MKPVILMDGVLTIRTPGSGWRDPAPAINGVAIRYELEQALSKLFNPTPLATTIEIEGRWRLTLERVDGSNTSEPNDEH